MNWDFDALEFLTFSGNKILGDHARWDPHEGENVKCSLLKMLEQSMYMFRNVYACIFCEHVLYGVCAVHAGIRLQNTFTCIHTYYHNNMCMYVCFNVHAL